MFECVYIMVCLADGRSIKIMTDLGKKIKPCYPSTADGREGKQTETASFTA